MKKYFILIGLLILLPITANAASANIDISSVPNKASKDTSIKVLVNVNSNTPIGYYEYTLDYDHDKLELVNGKSYNIDRANDSNVKSFKKQFIFKIKSTGANTISVKSYAVSDFKNNESMSITVNPASINNTNGQVINQNDNNNLSSLKINNYKIEPSFNKNTTNYILKIEDNINEINVIAKTESNKASIIGDGKHTLKEGDNRIEVTVTSESGKDKVYTIKVRLTRNKSIKVKIDGKDYTVVNSLDSYKAYKNYEIKKITVSDYSVDSLYNSNANITLLGLKDEYGKIKLFIYDENNNSYSLYNEITSDKYSILPIKSDTGLKNYQVYSEDINNSTISCYKVSSSSKFCNIYAINLETGEKQWYTYDLDLKKIELFKDEVNNEDNIKSKDSNMLIYILSTTTLLFGVATIVFAIKSNKRN